MISLTLSKVNFDELNVNHITKRPLLDSLSLFYNKGEMDYLEFIEAKGMNYYKKFRNIFELNQELNQEVKIFNELASKEELIGFDFKAINLLKRNLKPLSDNDYYRLNFDLRELSHQENLTRIKDIFLETDSVSLVDFKEASEQRLSLVYNKRGASVYNDEWVLSNARDNINLLENFKEAKDNNFIVARFILHFALKLKEAGIDESFSYKFSSNGTEMVKSMDEIIYWGALKKDEKEALKAKEREKQELSHKAEELAKKEIKAELNASRASLAKDSLQSLDELKSPVKLANIKSFNEEIPQIPKQDFQEKIEKIIQDSFELYQQKELEKTQIRLEKAKKDSLNAYDDLKINLNKGLSIIEALKFIQQKYRNEDTINFASLLFSQDILTLKEKENEIRALKTELEDAYNTQESLNDEITKREESIAKLKGTIQVKVNEIIALKLEFEEEIETLKESELKLKELEKHSVEQDTLIDDLDKENQKLSDTNKILEEKNIRLEFENENLKSKEQSFKEELKELNYKIKENFKQEFEIEKLKLENEHLKDALKDFTSKEMEYKEKISVLENKMDKLISQMFHSKEENPKTELRSKDILG